MISHKKSILYCAACYLRMQRYRFSIAISMFTSVVFFTFSSSTRPSKCHILTVESISFLQYFQIYKRTSTAFSQELRFCGTEFRGTVSLKTTIWSSLKHESIVIYPPYPRSHHFHPIVFVWLTNTSLIILTLVIYIEVFSSLVLGEFY